MKRRQCYHHYETKTGEESKQKLKKKWTNYQHIPQRKTTDLNELIYAGANLVYEKIRYYTKELEQKPKTSLRNSTGNADKKSTTTSKNDKIKIIRWNMFSTNSKKQHK